MKIANVNPEINLINHVDIPVDVHKDVLNYFFTIGTKEYTDEGRNRTDNIIKKLSKYKAIITASGVNTIRIICEPTGQYQNKLLRAARRMGFLTCYVNAENVSKFRVIETNDTGKTDTKDPRVIQSLGRLGKTITHRFSGDEYMMLRKLGTMYDEADIILTQLKCRLDNLLLELFCDYSFKKDFLYSKSGQYLALHYSFNPYRIVKTGFAGFSRRMRISTPGIRQETLKRLWEDAQTSVRNEIPKGYLSVLEHHFNQLMDDYKHHLKRKEVISKQMIEILDQLRKDDPKIPPPTPGVISAKNLARLLGETGELSSFNHWRRLMRYGGLNIRMRQSGKYQGQNKISKKGRSLLRKVLGQIVLPLVKHGCLYGEFYHHKRDVDKMVGNKAMVVVSRHFLRKFYGWYKSGTVFDEKRFFNCKSEMIKLAA